ncbi:MAG: hypothetical protein ACOYOF_03550, partial [Verrucomicrobiaceae bacterium]
MPTAKPAVDAVVTVVVPVVALLAKAEAPVRLAVWAVLVASAGALTVKVVNGEPATDVTVVPGDRFALTTT